MNIPQLKNTLLNSLGFKTTNNETFYKYMSNEHNCEFWLKVDCLSGNKIRVSIKEFRDDDKEISLFETDDLYKWEQFYILVE